MNWTYISGFFDADGSITLARKAKGKYRTPVISFHNNELTIITAIRQFIQDELGLVGTIVTKRPRKKTHSTSYDLSYNYQSAVKLCVLLISYHPKKKHRINVVLRYYNSVVSRNGKYNDKQLSRRIAFDRLFFWLGVSPKYRTISSPLSIAA